MIDLRTARQDPDAFGRAIERKGSDAALINRLIEADEARRSLQAEGDALRAEQKEAGRLIAKADGDARQKLLDASTERKSRLSVVDGELDAFTGAIADLLAEIPNPPHESVPDGRTDEDNVTVATVGEPVTPENLIEHGVIGEQLGIVDLARGANVSGSRFAYLLGDAVRLQLAIERLTLDLLTPKGFIPVIPPVLVREQAMYGTGFFPADRQQIYATDQDDLFLVGTSEVPLATLHADEILPADTLPRRYLGMSTCFRREAGTYGKDTKGIFRVHQFDKIEMFSFCHPDHSWEEHDFLLACEREIYDALGFAYRVVNVCGGDLGPSAAKKYDIEAWLPSEGRYREVTSASNTTDYQARRLKIRMRDSDGVRVLHTLNGTAAAIGRVLTFLLEQCQQPDGTVRVPAALVERGAPEVLAPRP